MGGGHEPNMGESINAPMGMGLSAGGTALIFHFPPKKSNIFVLSLPIKSLPLCCNFVII